MSELTHILIVEDLPTDADLTEREVKKVRPSCIFKRVETREEFHNALASFVPDLIISDFKLPEFDGLAALKIAIERVPDVPFIIVTGSRNEDTAVECMKAGAWDYVIKEHIKRLGPAVISAMEQKRMRQEHRKAEEALQKLTQAVKQSPASVIITDIQGNIEYVNPKFTQTTGYAMEEVVGQNPRFLKSGETPPGEYRKLWETITSGSEWRGVFHNKKKDGTLFWEQASICPIRDGSGAITHFVAVNEDFTERKSLEQQLAQAQKLESIGTLASGIAHDFNNILGIILGHSSLLKRLQSEPARMSQSIEAIDKATMRGASLVKQLLTFARKTESVFESVRINDIVQEITKLLQETLPKTIIVSTKLKANLPPIVADETQIHQVLMNLCVNARDAMPKGGTLGITTTTLEGASISAKFSEAISREYVLIRVADTGMGMDDATKQKMFDPFFTTKGVGKGTGLGLSLVHSIVTNHHGFIDIETEPGKGTTFSIYLSTEERGIEINQTPKKGMQDVPGGNETVLLIEDEEMLRELVKAVLVSKGYNVLTALDGEEGVEVFSRHQREIAVVVSDLGLPRFGGEEVYKRIRAIDPTARVILASGFIDPDVKSEIQKAGAKFFVQKPYLPNEVLQTIREIIDTKQ